MTLHHGVSLEATDRRPTVLLVDDDEVNRRMSSKFLQVFGCTIDVAVDGVGAVERMNLEKYDLVLMVSCDRGQSFLDAS